jgi:hypothetical protein
LQVNISQPFCRNMIRLFKVKEKQRELAGNANGGAPTKKQSAGELRLHKGSSLLFIDAPFFVESQFSYVNLFFTLL